MTSTPSATAASMAATRSLSTQPASPKQRLVGGDPRPRRHAGDRVDAEVPAEDRSGRRRGCRRRSTPCGCRGRRGHGPTRSRPRGGRPQRSRPLANQRAPMSLLLQSSPRTAHRPRTCRSRSTGGGSYTLVRGRCSRASTRSAWSEKLGCSGQIPVSMTPMITSSPTVPVHPAASHRPPGARESRVPTACCRSSAGGSSSGLTETTLGSCARRATCRAVSCCGEAVEGERVVVELRARWTRRPRRRARVASDQEVLVATDVRTVRVHVLARRDAVAGYPARRPCRRRQGVDHLDDVDGRALLLDAAGCPAFVESAAISVAPTPRIPTQVSVKAAAIRRPFGRRRLIPIDASLLLGHRSSVVVTRRPPNISPPGTEEL